jgi:hypothetical protein
MRTDVTLLSTSTATHHTGSPSCTPKLPVVSCWGSLGGVVVVVGVDVVVVVVVSDGGVVVAGVTVVVVGVGVVVGVVSTGVGLAGGSTAPPVAPDPLVMLNPGCTRHSGDAMAPWPTASPSESSTVTSGDAGTICMIDDGGDPVVPDDPADPDDADADPEDAVPPVPARGVGGSTQGTPELGI